jgi:hypothetical protein
VKSAVDEDGLDASSDDDRNRFICGRIGDNLATPFQCELCHYRNVNGRNPSIGDPQAQRFNMLCRNASINAFWNVESSTVRTNLRQALRMEEIGATCGIDSISPQLGPFPLEDTFGMKIAMVLLKRSLDPGKNEKHIQFSTARKIRSAFSNVYHSSAELSSVVVMAHKLNKTYQTGCPTYGYWFEKFMLGMHRRMGDVVNSDYAVSKEIVVALLRDLEDDWSSAATDKERFKLARMAMLLLCGYLCGLRGEEIMKVDIAGFLKYLDTGAEDSVRPHAIVPLLGRLKSEIGERYHMQVMARVTQSGMHAGIWCDRMGALLVGRKKTNGFMFGDKNGKQRKIGYYDDEFHERLVRVRMSNPSFFEPGISIPECYSLRRSLRRGSNTAAVNSGVPQPVIELNNRWRKFEKSKGMRPGMSMFSHYTDIKLAMPTLWRYSRSF